MLIRAFNTNGCPKSRAIFKFRSILIRFCVPKLQLMYSDEMWFQEDDVHGLFFEK